MNIHSYILNAPSQIVMISYTIKAYSDEWVEDQDFAFPDKTDREVLPRIV